MTDVDVWSTTATCKSRCLSWARPHHAGCNGQKAIPGGSQRWTRAGRQLHSTSSWPHYRRGPDHGAGGPCRPLRLSSISRPMSTCTRRGSSSNCRRLPPKASSPATPTSRRGIRNDEILLDAPPELWPVLRAVDLQGIPTIGRCLSRPKNRGNTAISSALLAKFAQVIIVPASKVPAQIEAVVPRHPAQPFAGPPYPRSPAEEAREGEQKVAAAGGPAGK